jgi:hypothetical protein
MAVPSLVLAAGETPHSSPSIRMSSTVPGAAARLATSMGLGRMNRFLTTTLMVAAMLVGSATFAAANQYGALAFSQISGAYGYSYGWRSAGRAQAAAMANCRARGGGCRLIYTFWNQCAALAIGRNLGYGYGASTSLGAAKSVAMANCRINDSGCYIAEYACN